MSITNSGIHELKAQEERIQSVQSILKSTSDGGSPLSERKVMIPITTKAFFEGKLQPTIHGDSGKEQVITNLGQGCLADMTIDEATKFLDRKLDRIRSLMKESEPNPKKKSGKLAFKKGFLDGGQKKKSSMKKSQNQTKAIATSSTSMSTEYSPSLPFIEIREEFDKDGNEIKSEAMNMSKVLQNVKKEIQSKAGDKVVDNEMLNALLDSVPDSMDEDGDDDSQEFDMEDQEIEVDDNSQKEPMKDFSSRLDELIRQEEEAEKKQKEVKKASKKSLGKGWAKGFLNSSEVKPKKKKLELLQPKDSSASKVDDQNIGRSKKVHFTGTNQVKEIPRIGQTSIKSIIPPSMQQQQQQQQGADKTVQELTSSLESTVLGSKVERSQPKESISIGGVMERSSPQVQFNQNASSGINISAPEPKKKLSRFAQRRLEQRS
jgi:prefoldin subunit 5